MKPANGLTRYAWLSIAAAVVTIALKATAWLVTGSVGLLSDAAESLVNLAAAIFALIMLSIAARPADDDHQFGHAKAEYFSAAVEGIMIFVAATIIIISAVDRFFHPQALENSAIGIAVAAVAAAVNGAVGLVLIRVGRRQRSVTLEADGKHLWTDVVTTAGVIVAVLLVTWTGWSWLDPTVALLVGLNIIWTGIQLLRQSTHGLMDQTLPESDNQVIAEVLSHYGNDEVLFHGLRTRQAGQARFAQVDMLVPGAWSVRRGHDLLEVVQQAVAASLPGLRVIIHLEPREDPRAYDDYEVEIPIPESATSADN